MEKEFIPYTEALELKQLGFNERCYGCFSHLDNRELWTSRVYTNGVSENIAAPTFSQAFRWFREKYNILATIYSNASGYLYEWHDAVGGTHRGWSEYEGPNDGGVWDTYEEAELACLKKLIEVAKDIKKNDDSTYNETYGGQDE